MAITLDTILPLQRTVLQVENQAPTSSVNERLAKPNQNLGQTGLKGGAVSFSSRHFLNSGLFECAAERQF